MNAIRILPESVATRIAAGEVVERPASVVRELLDNALDAEADRLELWVENGGKRRIRVRDNGVGMSRDDLLLCVERHATSKVREARDLFRISTFGFRGEALPSIGAVSKLSITTRPRGALSGNRLRMSGGKLISIEETGAPEGTTVDVESLFFNLPARRKFLRAARTEMDHILDTVFRVALAFPGILFRVVDGGRVALHLPETGDHRVRLSGLFGRRVAEDMIGVETSSSGVRVHGFLAPPEYVRSRADRMWVYVNGRNVRDRLLNKALLNGYGQRLMKGRYPQAVLFLEMDPSGVDVNVHPAKREIRFRDPGPVFDAVASAVAEGLGGEAMPLFGTMPERRGPAPFPPAEVSVPSSVGEPRKSYDVPVEVPGRVPPEGPRAEEEARLREIPRVIGQLGKTYIVCETEEGLLLVDQHAAHERVVYEKLRRSMEAHRPEVQQLLMPLELELNHRDAGAVMALQEELASLGIEIEHFGGNTFLVRAVPALLGQVDWETFLSELLPEIRMKGMSQGELLDRALKVMACHGAVRAGKHMSMQEMEGLLEELAAADLPQNCPHGRPVTKMIRYREIEKFFKRIV
ncbi:MAG: DNA mismatch repair endonuclease MutL [Deltaproteobacteria bacterium]|nr:DNA mismatch repair endonuclease MutL [Deltaproteobacteria bacterium]